MLFRKIAFATGVSFVLLSSSQAFAIKDFCTPKLESYIEKTQKIVDSKYVSGSKKETAQKLLDKIKSSRNETNDCVIVDKLLP
ncbi:hypothetical protein OFY17_07865 [Marinomonas sp. C2222]|uniref:Uncharacterized protein n=1 Tax=Marinomonas sargassi TaxID=2984494 RepID=A0ABT2YSD0_9GAMM|nr:hypothetical protein [Marinomonas sargassi]MCV2402799.1 hypothetical protein [Marinomonas sargassi]